MLASCTIAVAPCLNHNQLPPPLTPCCTCCDCQCLSQHGHTRSASDCKVSRLQPLCRMQIDMDTIETSNLNRQFLFRQRHVGQSKAKVAAEAVKRFRPAANITAHQV